MEEKSVVWELPPGSLGLTDQEMLDFSESIFAEGMSPSASSDSVSSLGSGDEQQE